MGGGRWSDSDWSSYNKTHVSGKTTKEYYNSSHLHKDLDPKGVKIRESRDSKENPNSTAIIVGLDVTGSMHAVLDTMVRKGLNTLITELYERKPVTDPHVMIMGIGDVEWDQAPLQVTQFEADIRLADQLKNIYLEGGGGGNNYESYILPWYFAAYHTGIDCFDKRKKKGYIFTVGDEEPTPGIKPALINKFLGETVKGDLTGSDLLSLVSKEYNVYHLMVEEGDYFRRAGDSVVKKWTALLGQRALRLKDYRQLSEVIISAIQLNEGMDKDAIIGSWKGDTAKAVKEAIKNLTSDLPVGGLVRM